jgi:hypothetical protein
MTVFDDSVMLKTGQGWKAFIFGCGSVLSALSIVAGVMLFGGKDTTLAFYLVLFGVVAFASSLGFACSSIRCPHCGAHWIWLAITRSGVADWAFSLASRRVCPACGR